ncbi:hypothetical protein ACFL2O_00065 [Thermodesulfobacteriota bacterium]
MVRKKNLKIEVNGYVSRITCGRFPASAKKALMEYLLKNRDDSELPDWIKKRNPNYLKTEDLKRLWYGENNIMEQIMKSAGFGWKTHWEINDFCDITGFSSGKDGIGLFGLRILIEGELYLELVPFETTFQSNKKLRKIDDLKRTWSEPILIPEIESGFIAVSGGTWAKGTALYEKKIKGEFEMKDLGLVLTDLTGIGTGEDFFVSGITYFGELLPMKITREVDREMFPISWFSGKKKKWFEIHELD